MLRQIKASIRPNLIDVIRFFVEDAVVYREIVPNGDDSSVGVWHDIEVAAAPP